MMIADFSRHHLLHITAVSAAFVCGLVILGFFLIKLRKGLAFAKGYKRHLHIVETLSLSPKRQIFLIRVKERELAIASTESGLQLLSDALVGAGGTTPPLHGASAVHHDPVALGQPSYPHQHRGTSSAAVFPFHKAFEDKPTEAGPSSPALDNVTQMIRQKISEMKKLK